MRGGREALARIIIWKEKKKTFVPSLFFFGEHDELVHRGSGLIDDGLHDPARPPRPGPAHFTDPGWLSLLVDGWKDPIFGWKWKCCLPPAQALLISAGHAAAGIRTPTRFPTFPSTFSLFVGWIANISKRNHNEGGS